MGPRRAGRLVAAGCAAAVLGVAVSAAAQFDRSGRRQAPGAEPLVFGPLPGAAWRRPLDFGMELPIGVDAAAFRRGLGPAFRMVLPGVGPAGRLVDLVVENVLAEPLDPRGVAGVPGGFAVAAGSGVYTGTLRGRPDVVVVVSVINGVLYSRFVLDDEAWLVYSDAAGRARVRLERAEPGGFAVPEVPRAGAPGTGLPGGIRRPERRPPPGRRTVRPQ